MVAQIPIKQQPEKFLMTIDEAAQTLSLSRSALYELVLTGQIASLKIGRARRVPVTALRAYIRRLSSERTKKEGGR